MIPAQDAQSLYESNRIKKLLRRYFDNSAALSPAEREEVQRILNEIRLSLTVICKYIRLANNLLNQAADLSKTLEDDLENMSSLEDSK